MIRGAASPSVGFISFFPSLVAAEGRNKASDHHGENAMRSTNNFAFKEWAAICAALGEGLQTLIVRKGGIDEGREGFRVANGEFWLFPTYLHEAATGLEPDALPLLNRAEAQRPPPGTVHLGHYAVV